MSANARAHKPIIPNLERMMNTFFESVACTMIEVCVDTHPNGCRNTNELALFPQSTLFYAYCPGADRPRCETGTLMMISAIDGWKFPFVELAFIRSGVVEPGKKPKNKELAWTRPTRRRSPMGGRVW
jgi:hypothetical protein